jgi:hypothetical protein
VLNLFGSTLILLVFFLIISHNFLLPFNPVCLSHHGSFSGRALPSLCGQVLR